MVPRRRQLCVRLLLERLSLIHLSSLQPPFFHYPSPASSRFHYCSPAISVDLWLCSLLAKMPVNKARQVRPKMSILAAGANAFNYLTASSSRITPTLSPSPNHGNVQSSYQPSPKPSVKPASLHQLSLPWIKEHSEPPLTTWLRPSGMISGKIPASMAMEHCRSFFHRNTAATATSTKCQTT